ncbi:hypothetical protein OG462_35280 [Streptomyces sp. NBC_01077]|nr:hypothetical protein OG462_35280 [Streptomyces sp. NBC_01077]
MTTPLSVSPRSTGRGLNLILDGGAPVALAWVCAMLYVLAAWALV